METCSLLVVPLRSDTISLSVTDRSKCIRELTRIGLRGMYNCAGAPAFEGDGACYILGVHVMKGAERKKESMYSNEEARLSYPVVVLLTLLRFRRPHKCLSLEFFLFSKQKH